MWNEVDASVVEALIRELEDVLTDPAVTEDGADAVTNTKRYDEKGPLHDLSRRKSSGIVEFSTYRDTTSEGRRAVAPLYLRLPPITSSVEEKVQASPADNTSLDFGRGSWTRTDRSLGISAETERPMPPDEVRKLLGSTVGLDHAAVEQCDSAGDTGAGDNCGAGCSYREPNFLPIMCARYISSSGIVPRARWGHTLTAIQGDKLMLFGGMDVQVGDTSDLFEYNTLHTSWDPVFVAGSVIPTRRTNHAACSVDERWLYISGGTTSRGTQILGDIYRFDLWSHEWKCIWEYKSGSSNNNDNGGSSKNEPTPRFGHTMLYRSGRLYFFGGKALKRSQNDFHHENITTISSSDIYVFSLSSGKWRKRIQAGKVGSGFEGAVASGDANLTASGGKATNPSPKRPTGCPPARFHHAACIADSMMYINGGIGDGGDVLSDTWAFSFRECRWIVAHDGTSVDALPREKHHLFVCGGSLLVVGGCSSSDCRTPMTKKPQNFAAVLPSACGVDQSCSTPWIPLAMGNARIVASTIKSFGAAFSGGFVHVFGGVCGCEPPSNTMVRFLAADGYFATDATVDPTTTAGSKECLTSMMRSIRAGSGFVTHDAFILPRSWGGEEVVDAVENKQFGVHCALLQQRAPKFWEDVLRCRTCVVHDAPSLAKDPSFQLENFDSDCTSVLRGDGDDNNGARGNLDDGDDDTNHRQITAYYTAGNSRIQGISVPLSADQLECLLDYVYYGDVYLNLLADVEDDDTFDRVDGDIQKTAAQEHCRIVQALQRAAETYDLPHLLELCDALLAGNRRGLKQVRERCFKHLQDDLVRLLKSSHGATATFLFVDPHTNQQVSCSLHPFILAASNSFFKDLLWPLLSGRKTSFQVGCTTAKWCVSGRRTATNSRRGIIVGPVSMPYMAVHPILRFLYTRQLDVPRESVFSTMLGSRLLGVAPLQAYCETILAREEVNYDTALHFYTLAGRYQAPLLQEIALLTAVLGFGTVKHCDGMSELTEEDARRIAAVAEELGTTTWTPPPQSSTVAKTREEYEARWNASSQ